MWFLLILFITVSYIYLKNHFSYWSRRKIPSYPSPSWITGNFKLSQTLPEQIKEYYAYFKQMGAPHGGFYLFHDKIYLPIDTEVLKHVLTKDFDYFNEKGFPLNKKQPLMSHLFNIGGEQWKRLRTKLTPAFTSGKLKNMFPTILECSEPLMAAMEQLCKDDKDIDIKDMAAKYATDVIGSCAFGIDCNSFTNPNSEFRLYGNRVFTRTTYKAIKTMLSMSFPRFFMALGQVKIDKGVNDFYTSVVTDTVKYREEKNIVRNDFLQLLIELKNKRNENDRITLDEITSQSFVFFLAGFETSSTAIQFVLLELSINKDIQSRTRAEIRTILGKYDGRLTYEGVQEMKYLNQVVEETLRMYPAALILNRQVSKPYKVPGTDAVLDVGTKVFIPVEAIHKDPDNYPDPLNFDPERFSDENKQKRSAYVYLPFGEGPRQCIGMRFGMYQTKVGLAQLLNRFEFSLHPDVEYPPKFGRGFVGLSLKDSIFLKSTFAT